MCLIGFRFPKTQSKLLGSYLERSLFRNIFIAMFYYNTCLELFPNIVVWTLQHFTIIANQMTPTSLFGPRCKSTTWQWNLDIWMILARRRKFILFTSFFTFLIRNTWPAITCWIRYWCIKGLTVTFFSKMINTNRF